MRRNLTYLAIWALIFPACAAAQAKLSSGDRVRIGRTNGTFVTGVLSDVSDAEVSVRDDFAEATVVLSRSEIVGWAKSDGEHRKFGRNFGLTVVSTSALGGLLSAVAWSPCTVTGFMACWLHPDSRGDAFSFGAVGGAIIGVPIGVIVGLAVKHEQWDNVQGPWDAAFSIKPLPGVGVGMFASISFR